jgi:hypothetical protein
MNAAALLVGGPLPEVPAGVLRWGGMPIPYTAGWSSESTIEIRHDPLVRAPAIFRVGGGRGEGRPLFGAMDEARCREVVIGRRCDVCARPVRDVGYVIDQEKGRTPAGRPMLPHPWTCATCFRLSLRWCPGIARSLGAARLIVARVRRYTVIGTTLGPAPGGNADLNAALEAWRGPPPIGYCSIVLEDYDVLDYGAVRALVGAA